MPRKSRKLKVSLKPRVKCFGFYANCGRKGGGVVEIYCKEYNKSDRLEKHRFGMISLPYKSSFLADVTSQAERIQRAIVTTGCIPPDTHLQFPLPNRCMNSEKTDITLNDTVMSNKPSTNSVIYADTRRFRKDGVPSAGWHVAVPNECIPTVPNLLYQEHSKMRKIVEYAESGQSMDTQFIVAQCHLEIVSQDLIQPKAGNIPAGLFSDALEIMPSLENGTVEKSVWGRLPPYSLALISSSSLVSWPKRHVIETPVAIHNEHLI